MPLSRKQFERGTDPLIEELTAKIHFFLNENTEEAYADSELMEALNIDIGVKAIQDAFNEALNKLIELEMAEKKIIGGIEYYANKQRKRN